MSVLQGDKLFDGYKGGLTKILAAFARYSLIGDDKKLQYSQESNVRTLQFNLVLRTRGKLWWWNGRHEGLKIPWAVMPVWVRLPSEAQ